MVTALTLTLQTAACKSPSGSAAVRDGGAKDSPVTDAPKDVRSDANAGVCPADAGPPSKGKSERCSCNSECRSGFCVDGVCCTSACGEPCKACNLPSALGDCSFIPAGAAPNDRAMCKASTPATCGQDGTCDGRGGCRLFVAGTICDSGFCDGDGLSGMRTCDGKGACSGSMSRPCAPYSCDSSSNLCDSECTTNAQCAAGQQCAVRSCGMKLNGFACSSDGDCASGHCADGVCCNVACAGPCVSCDEAGSVGRCRFIPAGLPDPACRADSPSSCGNTGLCDGSGACSIYPATTPCSVSVCVGPTLLSTTAACDGKGICEQPRLLDCSPFLCVAGTCNGSCTSDVDCAPGHACVLTGVGGSVTGTCGKKKNGQACSTADDCESSHCVDGLCCESSCQGACRSCALPGSPGQCVNVPAGAPDPRKTCSDDGKASCGENGVCDGKGACQVYPAGTECGVAICTQGAYTAAPTCNQTGQCVAPPSRTCSPYVCNGSACFGSCTKDSDCVAGSFCVAGSCGKKPNGADCSGASECQSGFCAQGVCCNSACDGACNACNLSASPGLCTAVSDGAPDPQGKCKLTAQSTCGTTGTCVGGACAFAAKGLACKGAACASMSSLIPASTCDGEGTCVTPPAVSCGTFVCSGAGCLSSCSRDSDCVAPNTCVNNSCGLKPNGAACTAGVECGSGICTEGVCCDSACSDAANRGLCMSCKVSGKVGTCSPVRDGGADPKQRCTASNAGAGDCSNDGTCNGKGACKAWSTGTGCRQASCSGSTFSPAANCDGAGNCAAAAPSSCDPYRCSSSSPSCLTTCTSDADCVTGETCLKVNNRCGGKLANGQNCKANSDCSSNVCSAEGVCCNVACNGACQSCALASKVGTCSNIAAGGAPRDNATCAPGATCGNTGRCNGAGGCQLAAAGAVCGSATCAAPTAGTVNGSPASESLAQITAPTCDGSGACQAGSPVSCGAYQCNGSTGQCKSTCTSTTADCNALAPTTTNSAGGNSCIGTTCQKHPNGAACSADYACASGHCVDGICCGSASCGACMACNLANGSGKTDGLCRAVAAGVGEPHGLCSATVSSSCGTDGKCNGAGACEMWTGSTCTPSQSACVDATHQTAATGTCNGSGACTPAAPVACRTGYLCTAGTCASTCTTDAACDSSSGYGCFAGACLKKNGQSCAAAAECGSGNCVGGGGSGSVCCASACVDKTCGSKAFCLANGSGCQTHQGDTCGAAACSADLRASVAAGTCDGAGACVAPAPIACTTGYLCSNGACASRCATNADCDVANGFACVGTSCKKQSANGQSCNADTDCSSGHCISNGSGSDKVCCAVACTNSSCGTKALCTADGSGCQTHNGEPCGTPTCSSDLRAVVSSTCDGSGNCVAASSTCTAGYLCAAGVCATSCTSDSACDVAAGFTCNTVSKACVRITPPIDGGA